LYCAPSLKKKKKKKKKRDVKKKKKRKEKKKKKERRHKKKEKKRSIFWCPFPFDVGDDSRMNSFEERGNDENQ
jgi:hypothetical protein